MKVDHFSPAISQFIKNHSKEWRWTIDEFADYLTGQGLEVVIDREQEEIGLIYFGNFEAWAWDRSWGGVISAYEGYVTIRASMKVECEGINFAPNWGGGIPSFAQEHLSDLFNDMEGSFVRFPEQAIVMKAKHWSSVDGGLRVDPYIVDLLALASEVPALAQWYEVADTDYANIAHQYQRDAVEREKGVVLLPYPPTSIAS